MLTMLDMPTTDGAENLDKFKVSVIIANYNAGDKINKNLEHLANQTMNQDDFEVIVVDDKSPNGIENIRAFSDRIKNLKVLVETKNNGYPSIPRNHGIDSALGEFIQIVDQDDYIAEDALEKMYGLADGTSDVIIPKYEEGDNFKGTQAPFKKGTILNATVYDHIISPLAPHKMFKRSLLNEMNIRFFSHDYIPVAEDQVFVMRVYSVAKQISILADKSYYFWTDQDEHLGSSERYQINEPYKAINILKEVLQALNSSPVFTIPEKEYAIATYVGRFVGQQAGGIVSLANQMSTILERDYLIKEMSHLIQKFLSPRIINAVREKSMYLTYGLYYGLSYDELKAMQDDIFNSTPVNVKVGSSGVYREIEISNHVYQIPVNFLNQEKIKLVGFDFDNAGEVRISINIVNDLLPTSDFTATLEIIQRHGSQRLKVQPALNEIINNKQFNFPIDSLTNHGNAVYDFYVSIRRGDLIKKYRIGKEMNEKLVHLGLLYKNDKQLKFYSTVGKYLAVEVKD